MATDGWNGDGNGYHSGDMNQRMGWECVNGLGYKIRTDSYGCIRSAKTTKTRSPERCILAFWIFEWEREFTLSDSSWQEGAGMGLSRHGL